MFVLMSQFSMMMYLLLMLSSIMAISSSNWLMTWAALEINMLSFIPLMISSNKFQESEAMLKYFLAQALGSSLLLIMSSAMWMKSDQPLSNISMYLLLISLILKLGMVPCHMWFPSVMASMSWISCLILSTWQKLAPLSIMMFMTKSMPLNTFALIIPSINALVGAAMGMNQTKLKSIMAFSSITHMGWMSSFIIISKPIYGMLYLMIYSLIIAPLFITMYLNMMSVNHQKSKMNSINTSLYMSIILLSLSGLPPLLGFFPKWMTIMALLNYPSTIITLLMGAMMNLFFYLNILFSMMMNLSMNWKTINISCTSMSMIIATLSIPILMLMMI